MYADDVEPAGRQQDIVTPENNNLDQLLSSIPVPQIIIDSKTLKIIHANAAFSSAFGYSSMDIAMPGFSYDEILCSMQKQRFLLQLQEIIKDPSASDKYLVYDLKYKNGEHSSFMVYAYRVSNTPEEETWYHIMMLPNPTKGLVFVSSDTRELLAEQFAGETFGTFEWLVDADMTLWSDGIYDIYEVDKSVKEITWAYIKQYTYPDDAVKAHNVVLEAMNTGLPAQVEYKIVTATNKIKLVHCMIKCVMNGEGKVVKLFGSLKDVTQKRFVEEDIEKRVDALNRSNKELEEFAYVASHDMQEPLRKISTFTDRLHDKYADVLTGDGAMYLDRVMASAENMRQLINNLLEFSRISKSTQPFSSVNLGFVLHQVRSNLELIVEETGTVINSDTLPTIEGSMSQLKQLFDNIINNAIKFRRADVPPVINITTAPVSKEEKTLHGLLAELPYYKIEVTDNGIGFEKEYADRIFQVFQRLHGKSEYPGSGIGLAICKKIVEHHHGVIYANSDEGQGAHFVFILPEQQAD